MTAQDVLRLLRPRIAQQELVYVSWSEDDGTRQNDWADVEIIDDSSVALTEVRYHRYVPDHEVAAELVSPTADLSQVVTITGAIRSSNTRDSIFRVEGLRAGDASDYAPAIAVPVFQKPETYLLDTPEAFEGMRHWIGCTHVYFREDVTHDTEAGEIRLRFWEMAEEIPGGPSGCAAFPYRLTIPCVEEATIRGAPDYNGYYFGPHLTYNRRRRRISFGQYSFEHVLPRLDIRVDATVSELAGRVLRTGVPTWAWEPSEPEV